MKRILVWAIALLVLVLAIVAQPFVFQLPVSEPNEQELLSFFANEGIDLKIPDFKEVEFPYTHVYTDDNAAPFVGAAMIDVDGDGQEEVFVGGGKGQVDHIARYSESDEAFVVEPLSVTGGEAYKDQSTYGVISLDINRDGLQDLIVARDEDVYLYKNKEGSFAEEALEVPLAADTSPLSITAADLNLDGAFDLYVSTFPTPEVFKAATFNDPEHGKPNVLLMNNGDNTFRDATESSGLDIRQNTFLTLFIDLNGDALQDAVIAQNTGQLLVYENVGNARFEAREPLADYGFWMGLTAADYDQDGDMDLFSSNAGSTLPGYIARGDLREEQVLNDRWVLLRNEGDFSFTNLAADENMERFEFAWGPAFADFNGDGLQDLVVAQNYLKWISHKYLKAPGRLFLQDSSHRFHLATEAAGAENYAYGLGILTPDIDQDGKTDLIYINVDGRVKALLNTTEDYRSIQVRLDDVPEYLGAEVVLVTAAGKERKQFQSSGMGYLTDQSSIHTFALTEEETGQIHRVELRLVNGQIQQESSVGVDRVVRF